MSMNLDQPADKITPTSGTLNVAGALVPTTAIAAANGGTGLTSSGTSGNVLVSNGTTFVSQGISGGTF